jgi:general secretion pathway protein C
MASTLPIPAAVARLYERHGRSIPRLAEIGLVILLAQALAVLAWKFVPAPAGSEWQPPTPSASVGTPAASGPNIERIASAHLFGEYQAPADPALAELNEAPDTRLDLTLLGILSATAERGSRALIGASNGEEKPYAIGDDVVRGVRLQAIFPDRVILARNGQLETLRLDKDAPRAPLPTGPAVAATDASTVGADTTQMLSNIREELLTDPSRAAEYIRIQPASNGGQLRGYRIYPGRDRAAFNAVGLRPGDLVTQVNGIQLNDANTALQMLGQLSQSNNITVVVERGGQQQTVNVNFN